MQHEKIIKREGGSELKITVKAFKTLNDGYVDYSETYITVTIDGFVLQEPIHPILVSLEEILSAKLELWEKLKPV